MHVCLLGPVEGSLDGRPIPLGTRKQRALLAMLALAPNTIVGVDRLIEGLWGEEPPPSAPKMVQLYVSHLRRLLAGKGAEIVTHGRGYELRVAAEHVDAALFERLVDRALHEGGAQARDALALWRGPPLADVVDEPFAAAEIRRLEELRLRATELAIDADLAAGRHRELIGELEAHVAEHPLSERLHAQRMLALYRSGRQAEALEAYRQARAVLVEEVGVEPGAELHRLHDAVLAHDAAALDLAVAEPSAPQARPPPAADRRAARVARWMPPRRPLTLAAGLALVAGLVVFALGHRSGPERLPRIDENRVGLIDPGRSAITGQYPVGRGATALTVGAGSVWVANAVDGTVSRIDRRSDEIVTIPVGGDPVALAFAAGSLWVTNREDRTVSQINPDANKVVRTIAVGNLPRGIAAASGALWVISEVDRTVARIDLASGTVNKRIDLGANPTAITAGAGALWITSEDAGRVFRVDPRSGAVVNTIDVGNGPAGVAVGAGAVWVANRPDATVSRIDPASDSVTGLARPGRDPSALTVGAGGVWVASSAGGTVSRIDPATGRLSDMIKIESSPSALVVAAGSVWTAALASPASHRGGTLRVEAEPLDRIDPGSYRPDTEQLLSLAYDGLVGYRRAGGATFGTLVGDLAGAVPEPSPDGKTYVFKLRPDIRYSDGAPVEPEDFRTSLEHLLRRYPHLPAFYDRIVGAPACRKRRCNLSKGIETDARARTITIHLTEPDAELLHALAFPFAYVVPAHHPFRRTAAPPGTGPYAIASFDPGRGVRLVRNRRFRVWSQDARPAGFADEITIRFGHDVAAQVAAVQRGAADVVVVAGPFGGPLSPARVQALAVRDAGQLYANLAPELDYMFLNVRTPPFDDVRVRRAINYATDRRAIAELAGAPVLAQPTCQILPPGLPGYTPSCRYTRNPNPAGGWTAPDLEKAHRLIEQSGTKGRKVTVWASQENGLDVARYFVSLLGRLGYRSSLRAAPDFSSHYRRVADSRTRAQIGIDGISADFAAPSTMTTPFACASFSPRSPANRNLSEFCDRLIDARINEARAARDPEANARWQSVYALLADAAPAVPLVNHRTAALVSKRTGNYQYHPLWGTLLDQLWVR